MTEGEEEEEEEGSWRRSMDGQTEGGGEKMNLDSSREGSSVTISGSYRRPLYCHAAFLPCGPPLPDYGSTSALDCANHTLGSISLPGEEKRLQLIHSQEFFSYGRVRGRQGVSQSSTSSQKIF